MNSLTLDQIQLFLAVVDEGSFTKAATRLNRARSAVTYGIQKLEAQIGLPLFDRGAYRPTLTEAGRTLLSRARRIADEADAFQQSARSLASGLEAELTIVMDSMFPVPPIVEALRAFTTTFPTVQPRVYVQPLGAAAELVLDGTCVIGLLPLIFSDMAGLQKLSASDHRPRSRRLSRSSTGGDRRNDRDACPAAACPTRADRPLRPDGRAGLWRPFCANLALGRP